MELFKSLNIFDGEKPYMRDAEQRREIDFEPLLAEHLPETKKLQDEFADSGGETIEEYFETSRGLKLFSRTLVPNKNGSSGSNWKGAVLYCHGYGDSMQWIQRKVLLEYARNGFLATGVEVEGHGFSDGRHALITDFKAALKDVDEYLSSRKKEYPELKWFVHGESMGGMFAINMCFLQQEKGDPFAGAVLIAPMCKIADTIKPPAPVVSVLQAVSKYFPSPSITPSAMDDKLVFKDEDFLKIIQKDPVKYSGRPRLATASEMYNATCELETKMHEMKTPFLVMHGTADVVTTHEASVDLYNAASVSAEDKKLVLCEGAWHGVLWAEPEVDIKENWNVMLDWILSRVD